LAGNAFPPKPPIFRRRPDQGARPGRALGRAGACDFLRISYGFRMGSLRISYGFPIDSRWEPSGAPMSSGWTPSGPLMAFRSSSDGSPCGFPEGISRCASRPRLRVHLGISRPEGARVRGGATDTKATRTGAALGPVVFKRWFPSARPPTDACDCCRACHHQFPRHYPTHLTPNQRAEYLTSEQRNVLLG
jgi:hypothetical protein